MINSISEGTLRIAAKIDPSGAIHEKEMNQQKAEEMRRDRPVENAEASAQARMQNSNKDKGGSSKYLIDNKQLIYEKYNKNGDLIFRIPPMYRPVDQRA